MRVSSAVVLVLLSSASARADSVSPWRWSVLRALTESADTIVVGTAVSMTPGQAGGCVGDDCSLTTDTRVTVSVERVVVGDRRASLTIVFEPADQPIPRAGDRWLLFLARDGDAFRLCFHHTHGAFLVDGDRVRLWMEGTERDHRSTVDELVARITPWTDGRVQVEPTASVSGDRLLVEYRLRNVGRRAVRVRPPSWMFDAVWAFAVRPGSDVRAGGDWEGVGHWTLLRRREAPRSLAPGRETTYRYTLPLRQLGMTRGREYRVGLRYRSDRPTSRAPDPLPANLHLGGSNERFVRVAVP